MRSSLLYATLFCLSCVQHDLDPPQIDCNLSDLAIDVSVIVNASSCSAPDGSLTVLASGGTPPYRFQLSSTESSDGVFTGLRSGGYSVTAIDSKGCEARAPNILVAAEGFSFSADIIEDTDCTTGNGSVRILVNDGVPPYEFRYMDEEFSSNDTFGPLAFGAYRIGIRDSQGCSAELEVTIPRGITGTSWENSIRPMINTYCALSGCHNGISRPDLRIYEKAKQYATQIKTLTEDGSMPFEGSLTQEQIDLFGCWVDEGALQN